MPHGVAAQQAGELVASAAQQARTSAQPNSSSHFTASRLLASRPERASWSPQQSKVNEHNGTTTTTTATTTATTTGHQHSSHNNKHAETELRAPTNHERDKAREAATSGRRRGWRRDSSHELSLSPSSSSLDEHEQEHEREHNLDEDDDQEGAADKSMLPLGQPTGSGTSTGKPHVGPMGIFFKVWSLVKVTKARHNKTKRQHSEDAGQMHHFALGDHPANGTLPAHSSLSSATAAAASGHQTHLLRQAHLLQDNHFRRAGSQPPPSSHLAAIGLARSGGGGGGGVGQAHLMSGDSGALDSTGLLQTTTTGTNGSSSGVSSTTSSTIATNSYVDQPALGSLQQRQQQRQQPTNSHNNRGPSWASRMKRSPVGADEPTGGDSSPCVSRYQSRRADLDQRQVTAATGNSSATPTSGTTQQGRQSAPNVLKQQQVADGKRQSRAHSEANQLDELRRRQAHRGGELKKVMKPKLSLLHLRGVNGGPLRRDSISDEDWAAEGGEEEDEEEEEEEEEQRTLADSEEGEEDSDPNDIYSTPNDSIQSVPSGGRLPEASATQIVNKRTPASSGTNQVQIASYQMTKSFSTNYFNNNRHAHKRAPTGTSNIKQIEENKVLGSTTTTTTTRLDSGVVIAADDDDDEQQRQQQAAAAARTQRSSNGSSSRFFISSSSSEDSNTPQQLQRHHNHNHHNHNHQQQQQLNQRHSSTATVRAANTCERVPVGVGLHYHAPPPPAPPTRPDSLLIPVAPTQLSRQQPPNLMTPSAMIINGLGGPTASVAAMSPMFPLPTGQLEHQLQQPSCQLLQATNYKKSPSLFEMSSATSSGTNLVTRFSSKYPYVARQPLMMQTVQTPMSSFVGGASRQVVAQRTPVGTSMSGRQFGVPHSISLHDCKLTSAVFESDHRPEVQSQQQRTLDQLQACKASEYKLAQMLLELGRSGGTDSGTGGRGGPTLRDQRGNTALMHAIISENLSAIKCLIEHGVDLNETNKEGESALDLVCSKQAVVGNGDDNLPLEMMKLLIEHRVDLDRARESDGSRLLDRLIAAHDSSSPASDKLAFIDCLLHNGAKLGSATWAAASGKQEVQLRLLRKLCQDGYFLYKKAAIEAAVYRFEYALKRMAVLEQQLDDQERRSRRRIGVGQPPQGGVPETADRPIQVRAAVQQVKYQTFLGLSRCERKRRFFKRALEFAHMSILVDSSAYEGFYSKAHILKDLGETDDALLAIDQTERLVVRSIETVKSELCDLKNEQEAIVFDGCFQVHEPQRAQWIESSRAEIENTLDYLVEARKHIAWLRAEILEDKKASRVEQ